MKQARGFSLLELIVVICVVAVLAGTLLSRIVWYQKQAEMAQKDTVVGVIRSALGMKIAQLVVQGRQQEISKLATMNPMDLLAQKPPNYLGEFNTLQNEKISSGNWYFNRKLLLLVYIASSGATRQVSDSHQFAYRIELIRTRDDVNGLKNAETSGSSIEGVTLERVVLPAQ